LPGATRVRMQVWGVSVGKPIMFRQGRYSRGKLEHQRIIKTTTCQQKGDVQHEYEGPSENVASGRVGRATNQGQKKRSPKCLRTAAEENKLQSIGTGESRCKGGSRLYQKGDTPFHKTQSKTEGHRLVDTNFGDLKRKRRGCGVIQTENQVREKTKGSKGDWGLAH